MQLRRMIKGFLISLSSETTRSSASSYSSRGISLMLPSVVMSSPMVECSVMTFCVPISAAILKGIGSSYHGVRIMRGRSFSMYPRALGTIYPTQSIMRTRNVALSSIFTVTACSGMNLGSVVIMVRPAAD